MRLFQKKKYNELYYTKIIAGANYILDWYDDFEGKKLDSTRWLDESLPHRSTSPEARKAKYTMEDSVLKLRITEDTKEFYNGNEGGFRTSGIQTYSVNNLHTYGTVNNVQPFNGYTTKYGYFEMRCKMPSCGGGGVVAWWLTGTDPETMSRDDYMSQNANGNWVERNNGEIDIVETLFSQTNVHEPKVHAWQDSGLKDWFGQDDSKVTLPLPEEDYINKWHTYAMNWTPTELVFYVDGVQVRSTNQSPQYEMCMYLNVYANDDPSYWGGDSNNNYPKEWQIDYIRVYKAADGYAN